MGTGALFMETYMPGVGVMTMPISSCSCLVHAFSWDYILWALWRLIHITTLEMPAKAGIEGGLLWPPVNLLEIT